MGQMQKIGAKHTTQRVKNDILSVVYHSTEVVSAHLKTGKVWLDTGGWFTHTTKARMNQAANQYGLPFQVFQKKGKWFVMHLPSRITQPFAGNQIAFDTIAKEI